MKQNRFNLYRWTDDSRTYKLLHRRKKIDCWYCKPNKGCNADKKHRRFDGYVDYDFQGNIICKFPLNYPSWKLVTKNKKQWMKKNITIEKTVNHRFRSFRRIYFEIKIE